MKRFIFPEELCFSGESAFTSSHTYRRVQDSARDNENKAAKTLGRLEKLFEQRIELP